MMRLIFQVFLLLPFFLGAQETSTYQIRTVAFYNLENLFDIKNDTLIFDDDRTPEGKDQWTEARYLLKIAKMSKVISEIGSSENKVAPDIIGVCEVENLIVLKDLIDHSNLASKDYGIIHFDSPDERGIDVALLYKKNAFIPVHFNSHRLLLFDEDGKRNYTRDQLIVEGLLDNEKVYY